MAIPAPLLEAIHEGVVVCPHCLRALDPVAQDDAVRCTSCDGRFPVRDGVLDFLARDPHDQAP